MTIDNTTKKKKKTMKIIGFIALLIIATLLIFFALNSKQEVDFSNKTYNRQETDLTFPEYIQERSDINNYQSINIRFVGSDAPKLQAWVADGPIRRSLGLSILDSLEEDQAMLFVFEDLGTYPFWMRDMSFDIDILWLNENREIVFIKEKAQIEDYPQTYNPGVEAQYVVEVVEGFVEKYGISLGDTIDW
jgi:uncharacterized membrane protein (UPF0127 family)